MRQAPNALAQTFPNRERQLTVALLVLAMLLVAACGVTTSTHGPTSTPSPSPSSPSPPPLTPPWAQALIPTPTVTMLPLPAMRADHSAFYYLASDGLTGNTAGALALADGTPLWHTSVPGFADNATIGGGIVYVGESSQGRLLPGEIPMEALNEANGALLWQSRFPAAALAPLAESGDVVFVQAGQVIPPPTPWPSPDVPTPTPAPPVPPNAILALRAGQSAPLWRLDVPGDIAPWAMASSTDGALYAVLNGLDPTAPPDGDLTAISARDGSVRWQVPLQSPTAVPVESGGVLYFSEQYCVCRSIIPSTIVAVRASDGKVLWRQTTPDGAITLGSVVVTGGMVSYGYALAGNQSGGGIVALHAADGSLGWQVSWSSVAPDGFAGGDGVLYAVTQAPAGGSGGAGGGNSLAVVAYDAQTGTQRFDHPLPKLPVQLDGIAGEGTLQAAGGMLYFVSPAMPIQSGGTVRPVSVALALRTSDGSLSWARTLDGIVQRSVFVVP